MPHFGDRRAQAQAIFQAGVAAADPYRAVEQHLHWTDDGLSIVIDAVNQHYRRKAWSKIHLIAFGKAACKMMAAALPHISSDKLAAKPIAVTTHDSVIELAGVEVIGAGHPLPDQAGLSAARRIAKQLTQAKADELVLLLISGGGSALLPLPVDAISLEDKIATTQLLLASGANINQINCVRKHLSQLKGGRLAQLAAPADVDALILSDVLGDDLSSIASGPTVPDSTTFADALDILARHKIQSKCPASVQQYLHQGRLGQHGETPKPGDAIFHSTVNTLVGSNALSLAAAADHARAGGFEVEVFSDCLCGEARLAAECLAQRAQQLDQAGLKRPIAVLAGGETTVSLRGHGKGGRNQELALAFALCAESLSLPDNWLFLSGGTDGRDGPTDAAGGIVDGATLSAMRRVGIDPNQALNDNDSYSALGSVDSLLITGPTGTNVADLQILLLFPDNSPKN